MRTTTLMRTALAVGGLAAALSLSACDGVTINFGGDDPARTSAEPTTDSGDSGAAGTEDGGSGSDGTGDEGSGGSDSGSRGGSGNGSGSGSGDDAGSGAGNAGSGSESAGGDTSQQNSDFTLDEDGNGTIPQAVLEEDIAQAYEDQGVQIDSVDCRTDMRIRVNTGSQSCDVAVTGDRTYYGVVKVTDVVGQNVHYKLEFAGIDF